MSSKPELVECLAQALHRQAELDNQSTTTACYNDLNRTLYVTHQGNRRFENVIGFEQRVRLTFQGRTIVEGTIQRPGPNWAGGLKKVGKHQNVLDWFQEARKLTMKKDRFDALVDSIEWVKVVLNQDLFTTIPELAGFHGESRIIRYHFLKYVRGCGPDELDLDAIQPRSRTPGHAADVIGDLNKRFSTKYRGHLFMASSQGACSACAGYMEKLGIKFGSLQAFSKERADTWQHPITMNTGRNDFGYPASLSKVLTATALAKHAQRQDY